MFKRILVPTDGSAAAEAAYPASFQFAKEIGATVTGLYVKPQFHVFTTMPEMLEDTREEFEHHANTLAMRFLATMEQVAAASGIGCTTLQMTSDDPYEAIIHAAAENACDLIAMASHGEKGLKALLIGSVTYKVLTHSTIPVLVFR